MTNSVTSDRIEKTIELRAPQSRVWQALTDHEQFGTWFRVKLDAPFVPGETSTGLMTWPGYEHLRWTAVVQEILPESYFSFTWHPYALDPSVDYSEEIPTLVEFRLEPSTTGTRLTVTESGFENVPAHRRAEAFLRNNNGWSQQIKNIEAYVAAHP
ncbi:SRPBCC family protein [Silvibacterium dinghuense]|uniref:Vanillate O-demethylase oxidoreductase VanB n=1 Tax=Silvibacterium dinghuense TaxID=1560006 RepID=A0A4Q1SIP5_9BACT|nr:SRPBCC family protein [Silvibacterium dinghuense]RXS97269.1 vanillate O-demethylase oxidoreductase VanB [Silvibacterium dinghuense]GGG97670.1 vanillate O-demethylase oxidoreductase VanB [Silvibacterium dinghuense]